MFYDLLGSLIVSGYEVHVYSRKELDFSARPGLVLHRSIVTQIKYESLQRVLFFLTISLQVLVDALRLRVSTLLAMGSLYSVLLYPAALISRSQLVMFLRATPYGFAPRSFSDALLSKLKYVVYWLSLFCSRKIIISSKQVQSDIIKSSRVFERKLCVVPNPVVVPSVYVASNDAAGEVNSPGLLKYRESCRKEILEVYNFPERAFILALTGELKSTKFISMVIRAVADCDSQRICLLICGEGPHKRNLMSIIFGCGLREQVRVIDWQEGETAIAGADLFLLPEKRVGYAYGVREALGLGVPVLAADIPDMRQMLDSDKLLFQFDHAGKLAERLMELASDRGKYTEVQCLSNERGNTLNFNWGSKILQAIEG